MATTTERVLQQILLEGLKELSEFAEAKVRGPTLMNEHDQKTQPHLFDCVSVLPPAGPVE